MQCSEKHKEVQELNLRLYKPHLALNVKVNDSKLGKRLKTCDLFGRVAKRKALSIKNKTHSSMILVCKAASEQTAGCLVHAPLDRGKWRCLNIIHSAHSL